MLPNSSEDSMLLIRCPSCGQRFKVGDDLRDRTVECGGCEHRFRINDDVIARGPKFYPSEGKKGELSH
ncbi:MAG: MJ0042-type zinc finger domain-containing protein, partial [Luteolibacter sp.]